MSGRQASGIPGPGASPIPSGHVKTIKEVQMIYEASIQAFQGMGSMFMHPVPMFLLAVVLGSWALATLTYAKGSEPRIDQITKDDINETTN